jgi:uncharacterized membrane protein
MITMTPQARAIAAFTLGVLLIPGYLNRLALSAYLAVGGDLPGGEGSQFVASLLTVVIAGGVLWFAHASVGEEGPGWETSLAQVGRLLAVIGLVVAVLATIAVLTSDGPEPFFGSFSRSF